MADSGDRWVTFRTDEGQYYRMRRPALSGDSVAGQVEGLESISLLPLVDLASWSYESHGRGLLDGLGIGAGIGALIGWAVYDDSNCFPFCSRSEVTAIVAVLGAALGAALGSLVGSTIRYQLER